VKTSLVLGSLVFCGLLGAQYRSPVDRAPESARAMSNPYDQREQAVRAGEKLYRQQCASCHGQRQEGARKTPPLNQPRIRNAPPGALFWVLRNGSIYRGMPSFAHLPEPQRWQIVTYLRR